MNRVLLTLLKDAYNLVEMVMDELERGSLEKEEITAIWCALGEAIKKYGD